MTIITSDLAGKKKSKKWSNSNRFVFFYINDDDLRGHEKLVQKKAQTAWM